MVTLKVEIDQDLHRELKMLAIREDKKIKDIVIEALERYIKEKEKILGEEILEIEGIITEKEVPEIIREIFEDSTKAKKIWERW